jgi:hypothetical protein
MPATSEAIEITSVTSNGSGPSGRPIAGYSTGSFEMSVRASPMNWLMPATYWAVSLWSWVPTLP